MPLIARKPPPSTRTALAAGLPERLHLKAAFDPNCAQPPTNLQVSVPHLSYAISADRLAVGQWVSAARAAAWAFLVCAEGQMWTTAFTTQPTRGRRAKFLSWSDLPADAFLDAVATAEEHPSVKRRKYEVRRLVCEPVPLSAVWFKAARRGDDLFIADAPGEPAVVLTTEQIQPVWRLAACRYLLANAEAAVKHSPRPS